MFDIYVSCAHLSIRRYAVPRASRGELKIMEIDIWRGEFMSNEADNKTPREFFRITSGLLVRYTRGSCMTRQKCPSGAHGRGENERGSPWYIAGLEKWFRRRGNRETPKCSLRFGWRRIAFPRVGRLPTRVRIHACTQSAYRDVGLAVRVRRQMHLDCARHPCSLRWFSYDFIRARWMRERRLVFAFSLAIIDNSNWIITIR